MISNLLCFGLALSVKPAARVLSPGGARAAAPSLCTLPAVAQPPRQLHTLLAEAGVATEPEEVLELSAGFCNWVYRVDLPADARAPARPVLVKVFSPLAKLRVNAESRGLGDELAGQEGLGPELLYRSADGLITDFVQGSTLTEPEIHARTPWLLRRIAAKLAALHSLALPASEPLDLASEQSHGPPPVVLWQFLQSMLAHVSDRPHTVPPGICLQHVSDEVARMRSRFDELQLPVVLGHGDLKPSNVMTTALGDGSARDVRVRFIDFELAGAHYRGYDLFKLFRTNGDMSHRALRDFLRCYARNLAPPSSTARTARADAAIALALDELQAETYAAEPLTWLEAAIFFLFAGAEYPSEAERWAPLALNRWERYLGSADLVDAQGEATCALRRAREARRRAGHAQAEESLLS